jgi:3-hydroxybutyryl-CoA dehydrogenase
MNADEVRKVLIVGAGTMGQQIAFQCASHGFDVVVHDIDASALHAVRDRIETYATKLVEAGVLREERLTAALARILPATDLAADASEVDVVSESVPEDPELKGRVLSELDRLCPQRAVFTTNTSTLVPSMFATATGRPDRFAALHFHQPVWVSNVADVMPHGGTTAETTNLLLAFARRIGQIPIHVRRESFGYVFNTMLNAVNREALTLVANGIATVEDVDRSWMGVMKMPIGPFGIMDGVGLDTVWHITDFWSRQLDDRQLRANADLVKRFVEGGRLGVKSGEGFYRYPDPAFARTGFVEGEADPQIGSSSTTER